jgi:5-formyltetrahydrofolate cyclo-ligase
LSLITAPTDAALDLDDDAQVKRQMRRRIRAERSRREPSARARAAVGLAAMTMELPEIAAARCVACYASTADAPGTGPLRQTLHSYGVRVLLPVLLGDGHLDWCVDTGESDPVNLAAPRGPLLGMEGVWQADVVIVPALAVDTLGNRLGQGAGFYDRTLAMIDVSVPVFALVFESEVLDAAIEPVPAQPHDRTVDGVITPRRHLRLPPRLRH